MLNFITWVVSASVLTAVVLLLRWLAGGRISAGLRYGLWAVVLIRLLLPISLLSLSNAVPQMPAWIPPEAMREESLYILPMHSYSAGEEDNAVSVMDDGILVDGNSFGYAKLEDKGKTITRYADRITPLDMLGWIWTAGAVVMGAVLISANIRFSIRLRRMRRSLEGIEAPIPVYAASALPSPCLAGLFRPAIYVTEETAAVPTMLRHVLAHELTHYRHLDHLWSILRGTALTIHWWNPLVWLAVICSRRDGELACDEGALKRLGEGERTAYGETLLALVTTKTRPIDLLHFSTTMTGGKRGLKERIQHIAHQPRQLAVVAAAVVVVLTLASLTAFGQAEKVGISPSLQPPGLSWNDSIDTVIKKLDITEAQILVNEQSEPLNLNDPDKWMLQVQDIFFFDCKATAGFGFIRYEGSASDYGLENVVVILPEETDMAAVKAKLLKQYGEGEAGKTDMNYAFLMKMPNLPAPQLDMENHHMYWTAGHEMLPEGYKERVRNWLLNVKYKSAPTEKIDEYLALAPLETLYWTDDWLLVTDDLTTNRITFEATQLVEFLQNVPLEEETPVNAYIKPYDVNRDGVREGIRHYNKGAGELVEITQGSTEDGEVIWSVELDHASDSWGAYFRCRAKDGLDYLLEYSPKIKDGFCEYSYRLFHIEEGREVTDRTNQVSFDINFDRPNHRFDPSKIAAFMWEVNSYIMAGEGIAGTSLGSLNLEELTGYMKRDNILITLGALNTEYSTEEGLRDALTGFASYALDNPDETWSPLADLLLNVTKQDVMGMDRQFVEDLRMARRESCFYSWDSYVAAFNGHGVEEESRYKILVPLKDSSTLHLFSYGEERDTVLMILDTQNGTFSAFYDAQYLRQTIDDSSYTTNLNKS